MADLEINFGSKKEIMVKAKVDLNLKGRFDAITARRKNTLEENVLTY